MFIELTRVARKLTAQIYNLAAENWSFTRAMSLGDRGHIDFVANSSVAFVYITLAGKILRYNVRVITHLRVHTFNFYRNICYKSMNHKG